MFDLQQDSLKDLREFFSQHSEALQNASLLLGGPVSLKRTQLLLDELTIAFSLTRRLKRDLITLYHLLTLENVHDPERIEASCFADIDPASSVVEDICLLTDGYENVLLPHIREPVETPSIAFFT